MKSISALVLVSVGLLAMVGCASDPAPEEPQEDSASNLSWCPSFLCGSNDSSSQQCSPELCDSSGGFGEGVTCRATDVQSIHGPDKDGCECHFDCTKESGKTFTYKKTLSF